jgi:hypothetical protein
MFYRYYPICDKHWDAYCDRKFKYKHFKCLRDYIGLPPIEKPKGLEHLDEDYFSFHMEILIDVELNVPVLASEKLVIWNPGVEPEKPKDKGIVKWNGKKEDPLELYVEVGGKNVVLLRATGIAVKFSSEQAIMGAVEKLQEILDSAAPAMLLERIKQKFKRSRFWESNDLCVDQIKGANGRT